MPSTALQEYRSRFDARRATRDALTRTDARLAHARLATFFSAVVLASLAWREVISFGWLLAPGAIFLWLVRYHDRILETRELAIRGIGFYERGLARLEDRWIGTGDPGERFRDDSHVYANDLDLFGRGSLFELLSLARTGAGESKLAGWLTSAADAGRGAEGVLRSLLERGAIGLITTHDLALTAIANGLSGAVNVHFEDWFENDSIMFDYRMKPGPVTRSNALALMRSVGLDVPVSAT